MSGTINTLPSPSTKLRQVVWPTHRCDSEQLLTSRSRSPAASAPTPWLPASSPLLGLSPSWHALTLVLTGHETPAEALSNYLVQSCRPGRGTPVSLCSLGTQLWPPLQPATLAFASLFLPGSHVSPTGFCPVLLVFPSLGMKLSPPSHPVYLVSCPVPHAFLTPPPLHPW